TADNAVGPSQPSAASNAVVPGRGAYQALTPARIMDTRLGTGGVPKAPIGPGQTLNVKIAGQGLVPATGAISVVVNVTATDAQAKPSACTSPAPRTSPAAVCLLWCST